MSSNSVNSYTLSEFSLSETAVNHFSDNLAGKDFEGIRLSVSESSKALVTPIKLIT